MKILPPADRELVRKASLLLRLARALNLGRSGAVRGARVRVSPEGGQADAACQAARQRRPGIVGCGKRERLLP